MVGYRSTSLAGTMAVAFIAFIYYYLFPDGLRWSILGDTPPLQHLQQQGVETETGMEGGGLAELAEKTQALREYLRIIANSSDIDDRVRRVKGYGVLGLFISSLDDSANKERAVRNRTISAEIAEHYGASIREYEALPTQTAGVRREFMFHVYMQQSRVLYSLGRQAAALSAAERAVPLAAGSSDEASALVAEGDVRMHGGDAAAALPLFQLAKDLKPKDLSLYAKLVACQKYLGIMSKNKWRELFLEIEARLLAEQEELKKKRTASSGEAHERRSSRKEKDVEDSSGIFDAADIFTGMTHGSTSQDVL